MQVSPKWRCATTYRTKRGTSKTRSRETRQYLQWRFLMPISRFFRGGTKFTLVTLLTIPIRLRWDSAGQALQQYELFGSHTRLWV